MCTYFLLKESETGSQEVMVGSVWLYHENEKKKLRNNVLAIASISLIRQFVNFYYNSNILGIS